MADDDAGEADDADQGHEAEGGMGGGQTGEGTDQAKGYGEHHDE